MVPTVNMLLPLAHTALKKLLLHFQRSWGMESLVGIVTTGDRAEQLIAEISRDWSRRIVGIALLEGTPEVVGSQLYGVDVKATFTDFMDWIRREALDEVYVDVPMDSSESFIPYLGGDGVDGPDRAFFTCRCSTASRKPAATRDERRPDEPQSGPQCRRQHCHDGHGGAEAP